MADFLGNQLQNLLNIKPIDLGQAVSPIAQGLQRRGEMQYQQGLIDEQNQTKNAAAQAMAVLNLPPEQRGQALQGLAAQAEANKDQKTMQAIIQLNEMDTVTQEAALTKLAALGGFDVNNMNGGAGQNLPSSVRETQWFNQQPPEVQEAHLKLKRGLQLTPQEKLAYERSLADIKAGQKGKEVEAVTSAETKSSDMAAENEAKMSQGKKLGELRGNILAEETQNFRNARSQTLQLKQLENALNAAETGKYSQLKTFAGKYLPGVNVDNEQALQSIVTQYALTELQKQTGPKTDFDFIKAAETQIQAGNTKGANKIILERMKENAKYSESRYEAFRKFKAKNKNFEDFEDSFSYESDYDKKNANQNKSQAPQSALDYLRLNPNQLENFKNKYGYTPEGF